MGVGWGQDVMNAAKIGNTLLRCWAPLPRKYVQAYRTTASITIHLNFSTYVERNTLPSGGFVAHLRFNGQKKYPILDPKAIEKLTNKLRDLSEQNEIRALFNAFNHSWC
jgi:hypothetical protein